MDVYPERASYYLRPFAKDRPIFQGDVFRGIPAVHAAHPAALQAAFAGRSLPPAGELSIPTYDQAKSALLLEGGYSILLPNPCESSEMEKGASHQERIFAQLRSLREVENQKVVRSGRGAIYTFWLPHWDYPDRPERDMFASFRRITTTDAAYLNPANRVAVLSRAAWIVFIQRLCAFCGGVALSAEQIAQQVAHLYPLA